VDKQVILHIGMPKTGSSSIQETLKKFNDGDTAYIQLGPRNHSEAARAISFDKEKHAHQRLPLFSTDLATLQKRRRALIERIETFAETAPSRTIFSAESVYHFNAVRFARLARFLGKRFGPIHVVGYLRPPSSFIHSSFQQAIKTGRSVFQIDDPKYRSKLSKIKGANFIEKVTMRRFARADLKDENVVSDFTDLIGITVSDNQIIDDMNTGMSLETTCLLLFYNRVCPSPNSNPDAMKDRLALVAALEALPGRKLTLDPALWANFDIAKDMAWTRETFSVDLSEHTRDTEPMLRSQDDMRDIAQATLVDFDARCAAADLTATQRDILGSFAQKLGETSSFT
jgi:hypothetical protein